MNEHEHAFLIEYTSSLFPACHLSIDKGYNNLLLFSIARARRINTGSCNGISSAYGGFLGWERNTLPSHLCRFMAICS